MVGPYLTVLDQIAKFLILLSDAPLYWFTLNTSCDHAFHLSTRLGMEESDYKALLIAGNLARYKGLADWWISFLLGPHFLELSPIIVSLTMSRSFRLVVVLS